MTIQQEVQEANYHVLEADHSIQAALYEQFSAGLLAREQYNTLQQKLQVWQILSRELLAAIQKTF